MVARISALHGQLDEKRRTPGGAALGVRLTERRYEDIWLIAAWPERLAAVAAAVARAGGVDAAPGPGRAAFGTAVVMRTEPLGWLLAGERELAQPELPADDGTVVDLGHARTVIRVDGPAAADLMARMAPIDFRPHAFPDGSVATSSIHHVGATVLARDGGFEVFVYRSFGLAIFEHLAGSAAQFGLETG